MNDPGVTMDSGHPIQPTDRPPTESAGQPGYGPNPTAQGVRGYRDLAPEEVATINSLKELQEQVARVWAAVVAGDGVDPRKAAIARTHFEEGFSALVGAIARPHDPFTAALREVQETAMSTRARSTVDTNFAQPSHDLRPDDEDRS